MPRIYDYVKCMDRHKLRRPMETIRYGVNELMREDLEREGNIKTIVVSDLGWRDSQFYTSVNSAADLSAYDEARMGRIIEWHEKFQAKMEEVFEWLSENTTGPWYWHEDYMGNNGNDLGISIHIEREPDIQKFKEKWGVDFKYYPPFGDEKGPLDRLAVIYGVLPAQVLVQDWINDHSGYKADYNEEKEVYTIKFEIREMEEAFVRDWGKIGIFSYDEETDTYSGHLEHSRDFVIAYNAWLRKHAALGQYFYHEERDECDEHSFSETIRIFPRYEEARQKFMEQWGDSYKPIIQDGKMIAFQGPWMYYSYRDIPLDFKEYLQGKRDLDTVRRPYEDANKRNYTPAYVKAPRTENRPAQKQLPS